MKRILTLGLVCLSLLGSAQDDFNIEEYYNRTEVKYIDITSADSNRIIRYIVTDTVNHYVSVYGLIYQLYHWDDLVISPTIEYEGVTYTVTGITMAAFRECPFFKSVYIPNTVTSIGDGAFVRCTGENSYGLREITVEEGNPNYTAEDGVLFNKDKTTLICCPARKAGEYVIPNTVTSIEFVAFDGCSDLTSVTIPNSVTSIGEWAFSGCIGLTSVTIGNSVTSIGKYAFSGCSDLTSVTIGNSVTSIGDYAFYNCTGLRTITFPNSVKSIGDYAFCGCSLGPYDIYAPITLPDSIISIGAYAFKGCDGYNSVFIPISVTTIGLGAFYCHYIQEIYCEASEKPDGWDKGFTWGYDIVNIVWGYKKNNENEENETNNDENNSGGQNNENQSGEVIEGNNNDNQNNENQSGEIIEGNNNDNQNNENQENQNQENTTAIGEDAATVVNIYAHGNTIVVENATAEISVYNSMGQLVCRDAIHRVRAEINVNGTGVYIVRTGAVAKRVMVND